MPKGLKIPVGVNSAGGAATTEHDENDRKIIFIALADDSNEHAFQQNQGLGIDMIFDINDPISTVRIERRIKTIFERFEIQKRFSLLVDTIEWKQNLNEGEMILSFRYLNIESDEIETYNQTLNYGG